jgi:hypothetical protein
MVKKNRDIIPYGTFINSREILYEIYDLKTVERKSLPKILGFSISVLSNSLPTLMGLGLVEHRGPRKKELFLSQEGIEVVQRLRENQLQHVKKIIERLLFRTPALYLAYHTINDNEKITTLELGKEIAKEFEREWKVEATYQLVGASCFDLLAGFGLIDSKLIKKRGFRHRGGPSDVLKPQLKINKLLNYVEKLNPQTYIPIATPFEDDMKKNRKYHNLRQMVDLGIVKENENKEFKLTKIGGKLKVKMGTNEGDEVLQEILLKHEPTKEVLRRLTKYEKFGLAELGEVMRVYNDVDWVELTEKWYARNFLSWLKKAGIIKENGEYGKYKIKSSIKSLIGQTILGELVKEDEPSVTDIIHSTVGPRAKPKPIVPDTLGEINGELDYLKNELLKAFSSDTLPQDRKKIKNAIFKIKNGTGGKRRLSIEYAEKFIDFAYKYEDLEPIKTATKILLELQSEKT